MKHLNRLKLLQSRLSAGIGLAVVMGLIFALSTLSAVSGDAKSEKEAKSEKKVEKKTEKKKKPTGAELYAVHCSRCHAERYATERTAAQWKTLMLHMRVRANLPADQAKTILKYLQEDSGTP